MRVREIIEQNEKWIPNSKYEQENPEVTVILPTFRRAQSGLFENAVLSVIRQSYTRWELIIVDDASTDGTEELIREFMKTDSRINCIRHKKNVGLPAISEYEGYKRGRGTYFAFIFDDNEWESDYLFKTVLLMQKRSIKASYGFSKAYADLANNDYAILGRGDSFGTQDLAMHNFIANGSVVLHRDVIEDVGLYDPHLSLTRLCDWDLWRRVCKKYEFVQTEIWATSEKGVCLSDSLGNSYMIDYWCALERMGENRDEKLRPEAYADIDIVGVSDQNTPYYLDKLKAFARQYTKKFWFDNMLNRIGEKNNDVVRQCIKKRVVVVHEGMSASVTLYMERMFNQSNEFVVKYTCGSASKSDLILADLVIVCRGVIQNEFISEWCRKLSVPCYYFVDDNYIELAKEYEDNVDIARTAKSTNRTVLEPYDGVIVSTPSLKEYFEDNLLHDKVLLMEPFMDLPTAQKVCSNLSKDVFTIGFLGGGWRSEAFDEYVIPAIKRISKNTKVKLYIPIITNDVVGMKRYKSLIDENLTIEFVSRTLSLDTILQRFCEKQIDVLVHCGKTNLNNRYKTENALLNAVQIGAVLLASDEEPYSSSKGKNKAFALAKNTINDWYEKLNELKEVAARKKIFDEARQYCLNRYSYENCSRDFKNEVNGQEACGYYQYFERAEILLNSGTSPYITLGAEKSFRNYRLGIGTLINSKIEYNFTCTTDSLREIGLLFGSFDLHCAGRMNVAVIDGNDVLYEQWFPISYFVRDDWTFINVGLIVGKKNKVLTIRFICEYENGSAHVGFFENLDKRTFVYKVLNKLGYHIKGRDAIITECR